MRAHRRGSKHRNVASKHEQILLDLKARCDSNTDTAAVVIGSHDDGVCLSTRLMSAASEITSEVIERLLECRVSSELSSADRKYALKEVEFFLAVYPICLADVDKKSDVTLLSEPELNDGAV